MGDDKRRRGSGWVVVLIILIIAWKSLLIASFVTLNLIFHRIFIKRSLFQRLERKFGVEGAFLITVLGGIIFTFALMQSLFYTPILSSNPSITKFISKYVSLDDIYILHHYLKLHFLDIIGAVTLLNSGKDHFLESITGYVLLIGPVLVLLQLIYLPLIIYVIKPGKEKTDLRFSLIISSSWLAVTAVSYGLSVIKVPLPSLDHLFEFYNNTIGFIVNAEYAYFFVSFISHFRFCFLPYNQTYRYQIC